MSSNQINHKERNQTPRYFEMKMQSQSKKFAGLFQVTMAEQIQEELKKLASWNQYYRD